MASGKRGKPRIVPDATMEEMATEEAVASNAEMTEAPAALEQAILGERRRIIHTWTSYNKTRDAKREQLHSLDQTLINNELIEEVATVSDSPKKQMHTTETEYDDTPAVGSDSDEQEYDEEEEDEDEDEEEEDSASSASSNGDKKKSKKKPTAKQQVAAAAAPGKKPPKKITEIATPKPAIAKKPEAPKKTFGGTTTPRQRILQGPVPLSVDVTTLYDSSPVPPVQPPPPPPPAAKANRYPRPPVGEAGIHPESFASPEKKKLMEKISDQEPIIANTEPTPNISSFIKKYGLNISVNKPSAASTPAADAAMNADIKRFYQDQNLCTNVPEATVAHYIQTRVKLWDEKKKSVATGDIAAPNRYALGVDFVQKWCWLPPFGPFGKCCKGRACAMMQLDPPHPRGNFVGSVFPEPSKLMQWLSTMETPHNLPRMCYLDTCLYYGSKVHTERITSAHINEQPPFYHLIDQHDGYNASAFKPASKDSVDALVYPLRYIMLDQLEHAEIDIPVPVMDSDGRRVTVTTQRMPAWREVSRLFAADRTREFCMNLVNPISKLELTVPPGTSVIEDVLRRYFDEYLCTRLLKYTIDPFLQGIYDLLDESNTYMSPEVAAEAATRRSLLEPQINRWKEMSLLTLGAHVVGGAGGDLEDPSEIVRATNSKYFRMLAQLRAILDGWARERTSVESARPLFEEIIDRAFKELSKRGMEGFMRLSDMIFRPMKDTLTLINDSNYTETYMPSDFIENSISYLSSEEFELPIKGPSDEDFYELHTHKILYAAYLRLNVANRLLEQLIQPALLLPGGLSLEAGDVDPEVKSEQQRPPEAAKKAKKGGVSFGGTQTKPIGRASDEYERLDGGEAVAPNTTTGDLRGGQDEEHQRQLKNIKNKIIAFVSAHQALLEWYATRTSKHLPINDKLLLGARTPEALDGVNTKRFASTSDGPLLWTDLTTEVHKPHAAEDRKYVPHTARIRHCNGPGHVISAYVLKNQLLLYTDRNSRSKDSEAQAGAAGPASIWELSDAPRTDSTPICDVPIDVLFGDFNNLVIYLNQHHPTILVPCLLQETKLFQHGLGNLFNPFPHSIRAALALLGDTVLKNSELCALFPWQTYTVFVAVCLRIYVAASLSKRERIIQNKLLDQDDGILRDQLEKREVTIVTERGRYALEMKPFQQPEEGKTAQLPDEPSAMLPVVQAVALSNEVLYQLHVFQLDHIPLLDVIDSTLSANATDTEVALDYVTNDSFMQPSDPTAFASERISLYETIYPHERNSICEDNLIDCASVISLVKFVSEVASDEPFLEAMIKVLPVVCQSREMREKCESISMTNPAFRAYCSQALACSLMGGYRNNIKRPPLRVCLEVLRWMQSQPDLTGLDDRLVAHFLRENAVFHIRNNAAFHDSICMLFPQWINFERRRVPRGMNKVRGILANKLCLGVQLDHVLLNALYDEVHGSGKSKGMKVFRRPRVEFVKFMTKKIKEAAVHHCVKAYFDGERFEFPRLDDYLSETYRDSIIHYVQTLDPNQISKGFNAWMHKINLSPAGVETMTFVHKLYVNREPTKAIRGVLKTMQFADFLKCLFFFFYMRPHYAKRVIPLPRSVFEEQLQARAFRYGIDLSAGEHVPLSLGLLYSCSLTGCGRVLTTVAQFEGPGCYGNNRTCLDLEHGMVACKPKKSAKAKDLPVANAATTTNVKSPGFSKAKKDFLAARSRLLALQKNHSIDSSDKRYTDAELKLKTNRRTLSSIAAKAARRLVKMWLRRPCHTEPVVTVPKLGAIVTINRLKDKLDTRQFTVCPELTCARDTVHTPSMVYCNGFSCGFCDAELRTNLSRPMCRNCRQIMLVQPGQAIRVGPGAVPDLVKTAAVISRVHTSKTPLMATGRPSRKKSRTTPTSSDNESDSSSSRSDDSSSSPSSSPSPRGSQRGIGLVKVGKKNRTDPLSPRFTQQQQQQQEQVFSRLPPSSPARVYLDVDEDEKIDLYDASPPTPKFSTAAGTPVSSFDEEDVGYITPPATSRTNETTEKTVPTAPARRVPIKRNQVRKLVGSKYSRSYRDLWFCYELLDQQEGRWGEFYFCGDCYSPIMSQSMGFFTLQQILYFIRHGMRTMDSVRSYL